MRKVLSHLLQPIRKNRSRQTNIHMEKQCIRLGIINPWKRTLENIVGKGENSSYPAFFLDSPRWYCFALPSVPLFVCLSVFISYSTRPKAMKPNTSIPYENLHKHFFFFLFQWLIVISLIYVQNLVYGSQNFSVSVIQVFAQNISSVYNNTLHWSKFKAFSDN